MLSEILWQCLLDLNKKVKNYPGKISQIQCDRNGGIVISGETTTEPLMVEIQSENSAYRYYAENGLLKSESPLDRTGKVIQLYLPIILSYPFARQKQSCITFAHFAQTIDGKIATVNNQSKWIGNEENLIHAHRMRALCDGILIGSGTFLADDPALNVRHVKGPDPVRIIIGSSSNEFVQALFRRKDELLVISTDEINIPSQMSNLTLTNHQEGIFCKEINKALYRQGIYNLYIEGGATTTSKFLEDRALDYLQVHIFPIIFGSGKDAFRLPNIHAVEEAVGFLNYQCYQIGRAPMFAGVLNKIW